MSEHSFDKYVRDKLSNYASPVPDGLWEKIAHEKKRKPAAIWWQSKVVVLAGLLFTTLAIGGFMLYQKHQLVKQQEQSAQSQPNTQSTSSQQLQQNILLSEENKKNNTKTENNISESTENQKEKIKAEEKSTTENINKTSSTQSLTIDNKLTATSKNTIETTKTVSTKNIHLNKLSVNHPFKSNTKTTSTVNRNNNSSSTNNVTDYLNEFSFSKAQLQPINWNKPFITEKSATGLQVNLFKPKDCPAVNGNRRDDWYLELYASPDYVFKKTYAAESNTSFLAKKDSSETMRGGFTLGARISKNITENILLKAGVQFAQMNEKLSLRRENERRVITVVTIKTVTDASGNVSTVSDTSTVIQIGYVESNSYNYYRNIELPVSLSYEMGNKNFKTAINAGVILNIASWYKGKVLDTTFQMVNVSPKENDGIAKHSVGLSLYGSISFIKPVNEQTDVFAEPYFRYNISKLQNTAYNFSQRFSAVGLTLGVRYKLNYRKQHY